MVGYALRLFSGYIADKTRSYWMLTIVGYVLNLAAVPLLAVANGWMIAAILIVFLTGAGISAALLATLVVLLGLSGQDLRRWSLDHRGYLLAQIIVAHTELEALGQLLERRPDLRGTFLPPQVAR